MDTSLPFPLTKLNPLHSASTPSLAHDGVVAGAVDVVVEDSVGAVVAAWRARHRVSSLSKANRALPRDKLPSRANNREGSRVRPRASSRARVPRRKEDADADVDEGVVAEGAGVAAEEHHPRVTWVNSRLRDRFHRRLDSSQLVANQVDVEDSADVVVVVDEEAADVVVHVGVTQQKVARRTHRCPQHQQLHHSKVRMYMIYYHTKRAQSTSP